MKDQTSGNEEKLSAQKKGIPQRAGLSSTTAVKELHEKESLLYLVAENTSDVFFVLNVDSTCSYVSQSIVKFTGHTVEEFMTLRFEDYLVPESLDKAKVTLLEELTRKPREGEEAASRTLDLEFLCKDGSRKWGEVRFRPLYDASGRLCKLVGVVRDETDRFLAEKEKEAMLELHRLCAEQTDLRRLIQGVTAYLKKWSGCDVMGIRLREGDDFPYYETSGFPLSFIQAENRLCAVDEKGQLVRDSAGNPVIECMCGNIVCGRFDPAKPFFTSRGSFWTNSTTELLASTTEADRFTRTRNRCNTQGYESLALIPLRSQGETFGLLQFNGLGEGLFTKSKIAMLERVADTVAIALSHRKTREALEENERRFRIVANNTWDWEFWQRPDGSFEYVSPSCKRITGIEASEFFEDPGRLLSIVYPEDRESFEEHIIGELQGKDCEEIVFRIVLPDGSHRWIGHVCQPVFGETGRFLGVRGSNRDITKRKQAEDALKEKDHFLQDILETTPNLIYIYDLAEHRNVYVNRELTCFLGYTPQQVQAMGSDLFPNILNPEDVSRIAEHHNCLAASVEGQVLEIEYRMKHADGKWRWLRSRDILLREEQKNKSPRILGSAEDITVRKRAEEEIRRSEKRFRTLFNSMTSGVAIYKPIDDGADFLFIDMNEAGLRICNTTLDQLTGHRVTELFPAMEETGILDAFRMAWQTGDAQYCPVTRYEDGRIGFWVDNRVYRLLGEEIVAVFDDVTARKTAEQTLRESEEMFSTAFYCGPLLMTISDIQTGKYLKVNENFVRISGYSRDDAVGATSVDLGWIAPEERELLKNEILANGRISGRELELTRKNGDKILCLYSGEVITVAGEKRLLSIAQDITERKHSETALRESEQRYRSLFESSLDGILMTVPDGRVLDANPAACAMLSMTRDEICMAGCTGIVEPSAELASALQEHERTGKTRDEFTFIRNGGTKFIGEAGSVAIAGGSGFPRSFLIFRDITEHKLAEKALRDSENLFRTLAEKSMAGIYVVQDGAFKIVNPNAASYVGYEPAEMIGMRAEDLIQPEDRIQAREYARRMLCGELDAPYEFRVVTKQGDTRWVLETVSPFVFEGKRAILGNSMDITVLKLAAEALKLSEVKYRRIVDTANEGIWAMDGQRVTIFANARIAEMLGYIPEEMVGRPVEEFMFEEDFGDHEARMKARARGEDGRYEHRFRTKDGSTLWTIVSSTALQDEDGRFAGSFAMFTDITDRKKAEEDLRESRAQLNLALQAAGMGTWHWNIAEDRRYCDKQVCQLLGIDPATFVGTAEQFFESVHPDDRQKLSAALHRTIEQDMMYEPEYRAVWPDGSIHYIAARGTLVRDDKGRPDRIDGVIWDITERKAAQDALLQSEARFRLLIESAPDGVFVQTKGRVRYLNRAALRIFGADSPDQLMGRPFMERIHPDFREQVRKRSRTVTEERQNVPIQEQVYLRLDGTPVDVSVSVVPIHYGGEDGGLVFLRDITEQKQAREALKQSEEQYRHMFENALDGVFRTSVDGRYLKANPALARMFGFGSPEEMIGQVTDIGRQLYVDPNERERCIRSLQEKGTLRRFDVKMRRRDGTHIWTVISSQVVKDKAGRVLYIEGMISDITDLKRAEAALKESERRLRQAQKMEAIGTLAGGIAHDFNNILAAIIGYSEMSFCSNVTKKQILANLEHVLKAGLRAKELIKQILTFSRQGDNQFLSIQISPLLKEAVKMLRATLPATIRIRQNIRSSAGAILADPTQIHQVVMNLATNAAHAMHKTGGTLGIELVGIIIDARDAEVIHADLHAGPYLRLTVSDTGRGIEPSVLQRIFDPFFTTKEPGEGTGMGLAVVHGIVKCHGGVIIVESEPGKGTIFNLYFPMMQSEAMTAEAGPTERPAGKGKGQVLFVDDEESLVLLSGQMLSRLGYNVVTCTSSLEALEAFRANPSRFDLVITDQTMPQMTGLEIAQEMLRIRPDIPIILCTGFSEVVTPEKAKSAGIREFLMKPLVMRQMADIIAKVIAKQRELTL